MSTTFSASAPSHHQLARGAAILGRAGLAARGIVYVFLGGLVARAGFGFAGGKITDKEGALQEIGQSRFGDVALWVIGLGLIAYIAWKVAVGVLDLEHYGGGWKGWGKRAGKVITGFAYIGASTAALSLAAGRTVQEKGGDSTQQHAAWLMSQPFGRWLVAIAGGIIVGVAGFQLYQAYSGSFAKHLRGGGISPTQEKWSVRLGRGGYAARGVAFALIAWFFLQAALHADASEAGGVGAALATMAAQPFGPWLLGTAGVGFAFFGLYSLVEARYRRLG